MRILFVDNHPELTSVVVGAFLGDHQVVVVPTIAAARAATEADDFDVALVDYDLDDGKGTELVRWVRTGSPDKRLPLVGVSARAEGNAALAGAGVDRVCAKADFARIGAVLDAIVRVARSCGQAVDDRRPLRGGLVTREQILERARTLTHPRAIEAYWDGDTTGWFLVLHAVGERELGIISEGSDIRLFNGAVPPWPEAALARELGQEIASWFGVPFWFPSPEWPEDDAARFDDRERAVPCRVCRIPLVQREPCPWRGVCHHCHLAEKGG